MKSKRSLSDNEREILLAMLAVQFPGSTALLEQLESLEVVSAGDMDGYGSIYLKPTIRTKAPIRERVPVEATVYDEDSVPIQVLLHVVDGYMNELEIYKADGTPIRGKVSSSGIKVTVNES